MALCAVQEARGQPVADTGLFLPDWEEGVARPRVRRLIAARSDDA